MLLFEPSQIKYVQNHNIPLKEEFEKPLANQKKVQSKRHKLIRICA